MLFQRLRVYVDNPLYIGDMRIGHEDTKQLDALREALINMLMHCDYFSPMKPRIRVFTNRVEFENPGALPRPIEELMKEDVSVLRNPVLAKLFRIAKLCENAGYGFDKMMVWKKETQKEVRFETSIDKTKVTFMLKNGEMDMPGNMKADNNVNGGVNDEWDNDISELQKNIIKLMKKSPAITISKIEQALSIPKRTIENNLKQLKEKGIVKREGSDKAGHWIIL